MPCHAFMKRQFHTVQGCIDDLIPSDLEVHRGSQNDKRDKLCKDI